MNDTTYLKSDRSYDH